MKDSMTFKDVCGMFDEDNEIQVYGDNIIPQTLSVKDWMDSANYSKTVNPESIVDKVKLRENDRYVQVKIR